jgi:hypothetical protein
MALGARGGRRIAKVLGEALAMGRGMACGSCRLNIHRCGRGSGDFLDAGLRRGPLWLQGGGDSRGAARQDSAASGCDSGTRGTYACTFGRGRVPGIF